MIALKIHREAEAYSKCKIAFGPMFTDAGFRGIYFLYKRKNKKHIYQLNLIQNKWKYLTFIKRVF